MNNLLMRVITSITLILFLLLLLFVFPKPVFVVCTVLLLWLSCLEWLGFAKMSDNKVVAIGYPLVVIVAGLLLYKINFLFALTMVTTLFYLLGAPIYLGLYQRRKPLGFAISTSSKLMVTVLGGLLLLSFSYSFFELFQFSPLSLLGILVMVWVGDSAAYFVGKHFGRHKLLSQVSPNKTIEGAVGALLAVIVVALILYVVGVHLSMGLFGWLVCSLTAAMLAIVGDLFESVLKRLVGLKDSGKLLPGHGGVLDRCDGLLPVLPFWLLVVKLF